MSDRAVISGQLVDARNVGQHKSVKLTVHVPEEEAMKVFSAFGWPTMVNPVPVAVARLNGLTEPKPKKGSLAQQSGICCGEPAFLIFLEDHYTHLIINGDFEAAEVVRKICGVESRAEFDTDPAKGQLWRQLHGKYLGWCRQ